MGWYQQNERGICRVCISTTISHIQPQIKTVEFVQFSVSEALIISSLRSVSRYFIIGCHIFIGYIFMFVQHKAADLCFDILKVTDGNPMYI